MFTRTIKHTDTFGMATSTARRVRRLESGVVAAEQGRHSGGPCPAVALATLTGWSYARAERLLQDFGFRGRGMVLESIRLAFIHMFGLPRTEHRPSCSVAGAVKVLAEGCDGIVFCRGHVMPIRNGRLLNASVKHAGMPCTHLMTWNIAEEVR